MEAADQLGPAGRLRSRTYAALLSLLAATGLRISEALALRFADITADGLLIRETKFRKTRLVPLHDTAVAGLERYVVRRRRVGSGMTTSSSAAVVDRSSIRGFRARSKR